MTTPPSVRYFLLCNDVWHVAADPHRVTIIGLVTTIRSREGFFPIRHPVLNVYLQLSGCRGSGFGKIRIVQADTDQVIFESQSRSLEFSSDPLETFGVRYRLQNLLFKEAGLYMVEFWYNETVLDQRPLWVK